MPECGRSSKISIVIPTYNRASLLKLALEGYRTQKSPDRICEILVVDDGSTDQTEATVQSAARESPFPIRYLRQNNKGPAAARNFGIREAGAELVLFTDSDVIPSDNFVEQHLEWHRRYPARDAAILGYLKWSSEVNPTPFMRWYGDCQLFAFRRLQPAQDAGFRSFYTCNLSLKTDFLRTCGLFDEEFRSAAFEDTELGYRLARHGMRLLYNPAAVACHHQFFSFEEACGKTRANSAAARLFFSKDAGQEVRRLTAAKQSRLGYKIGKLLAKPTVRMLAPLRRLLNSALPLPGIVYHLFFWADACEPLDEDAPLQDRVGQSSLT
jgi:glycosyltransferase involved in cell wall biosynthesis